MSGGWLKLSSGKYTEESCKKAAQSIRDQGGRARVRKGVDEHGPFWRVVVPYGQDIMPK